MSILESIQACTKEVWLNDKYTIMHVNRYGKSIACAEFVFADSRFEGKNFVGSLWGSFGHEDGMLDEIVISYLCERYLYMSVCE